jgi:hypothetical protein
MSSDFLLPELEIIFSLKIGLFGLVGMLGVLVVPFSGRLIDRVVPWYATLIATSLLLVSQAVQTAAGGINVAAVVIACFALDVGRQAQQVSMTTRVLRSIICFPVKEIATDVQ